MVDFVIAGYRLPLLQRILLPIPMSTEYELQARLLYVSLAVVVLSKRNRAVFHVPHSGILSSAVVDQNDRHGRLEAHVIFRKEKPQ